MRGNILNSDDCENMFCVSQLSILYKVNSELLNQFKQIETLVMSMEQMKLSPRSKTSIGQTFFRLTAFLKNYLQYSNHLETCITFIKNRELKDKSFKIILKKLQQVCLKIVTENQSHDRTDFDLYQIMKLPLKRLYDYKIVLLGKFKT